MGGLFLLAGAGFGGAALGVLLLLGDDWLLGGGLERISCCCCFWIARLPTMRARCSRATVVRVSMSSV